MVVLKFHYTNTVRRVDIEVNKRDSTYPSLHKLHNVAREIFQDQGVVLPEELLLKYWDEEGDLITVTSKRELQEAFDCMIHKCNKIPKFFVYDKNPKKASQVAAETAQQAIQTINSKAVHFHHCLQKEFRDLESKFPSGEMIQKIPGALKDTFEKVSVDAKKLANEVEKTVRDTVQKVKNRKTLLLASIKKEQLPSEATEEPESIKDEEEEPLLKNAEPENGDARLESSTVDTSDEYVSLEDDEEEDSDQEEDSETEPEEQEEVAEQESSPLSYSDWDKDREEDPFDMQLTQLEDMGFSDRVKNRQLLEQYKGDIVATIRDLLDHLDV